MASLGIGWIALWMTVAGFAPNYPILITSLLLGGLGSGAFHPQGAVYAARNTRRGTGTSVFFVGGRLGFTVAPFMGGVLFATIGPPAMIFASLFGVLVALGIWFSFPDDARTTTQTSGDSFRSSLGLLAQVPIMALVGFIVSQALRSGVDESYLAYMPKLFLDKGLSPVQYGLVSSAYVAGSSMGGLIGGFLADRYNKKRIISTCLILSAPVMYAFIHAEPDTRLILAALTGLLLAIPFTPVVLLAQELMPDRLTFITGITMSFLFICGALATSLVGVFADSYGLSSILGLAAGILAVAAVFSLLIPSSLGTAPLSRPVPVPVSVESDIQ